MSVLLSGPGGAGKSVLAREILATLARPGAVIDFQEIYAMLAGISRDPETGRYPPRLPEHAHLLALAEYLRRAAITATQARDVDIVITNSDGNPRRRGFLLSLLKTGSREVVLDPGVDVIFERLTLPGASEPSDQCKELMRRWYGVFNRERQAERGSTRRPRR